MVPDAPPPYRHLSSTPISLPAASSLLATFLSNSEAHPHLHPDALITPTGVTFSSHGGPLGGVVMHNLRRVAAGLRGEYLEPEATPELEEDEGRPSWRSKQGTKAAEVGTEVREEGWQDMSEYEREVEVAVGEIGERTHFVAEGAEAEVAAEVEVHATGEEGGKKRKTGAEGETKVDKEARKKAKKEREKELKRQKAQERAAKA